MVVVVSDCEIFGRNIREGEVPKTLWWRHEIVDLNQSLVK